MRREKNQLARTGTRKSNHLGLLLGAFSLLWSIDLAGKDSGVESGLAAAQDDRPQHVLVVSIPDRKLALIEDGRVVKVYEVAVGKPSTPSPTGEMKIINKVVDPTYYHKGKIVKPGKSNPLGNRWMGLSSKGYGIHGTNVQSSTGKAASHGCFRMRKHDAEELFNLVRVGDAVEIHAQRDSDLAEIFAAPSRSFRQAPLTANLQRAPVPSVALMAAMAEGN